MGWGSAVTYDNKAGAVLQFIRLILKSVQDNYLMSNFS